MYVQLYAKSDYSLLESPSKPEQLAQRAAELRMPAMALTDHNSMGSAFTWYTACRQEGVRPIFGLELDIQAPDAPHSHQVVLLAETQQGYSNLLQLASLSGPADFSTLAECASGLIGLNPQNCGDIIRLLSAGHIQAAEKRAAWYQEVFGDEGFYVLLESPPGQGNGLPNDIEAALPSVLFAVSPMAAIITPDQRPALQAMQAMRDNTPWHQAAPPDTLLRSADEMADRFAATPQALAHTAAIAERCQVELQFSRELPQPGETANLRDAVQHGLLERGCASSEAKARVDKELTVIESLGFSNYFLIVADIVQYAKRIGIPVGPGRGSAAASMTAYCLHITDINPLDHGLIFERFLNEHRQGFPDIDLDFCQERRAELFTYTRELYGRDHTAQIGTYSTFGLRAAVREAARVRSIPSAKAERVLQAGDSFDEPQVQRSLKACPELAEVVEPLLGVRRHFSIHAAGIVITPRPVTEYTSVRDGDPLAVTHAPMDAIEGMGLLKIDFLGLRTLTLLQRVEESIQAKQPEFKLEAIPHDDTRTFQLLASGASAGLFQLESSLFRELLREFRPTRFRDLVALLALGRPGPLSHVQEYVKRRDGDEPVRYAHPLLEDILGETQGLMIYQEQVMAIAHRLGGLSLTDADALRRAMSKKDRGSLAAFRSSFVQGCTSYGVDKTTADALFSDMEKFAEYAFNKAHSAAYAEVTYRTAFLKAHFPHVFMAQCLNLSPSERRHRQYLWDCIRLGLRILPPDIRYADNDYQPEGDAGIRIGLTSLKGIGASTGDTISAERQREEFSSLSDFRRRTGLPDSTVKTLILAGAFDGFSERSRLLRAIEPEAKPLSRIQLLEKERELLGLYVSEHPAEAWQDLLEQLDHGFPALVCGEIVEVDRQNRWAYLLGLAGVYRLWPSGSGASVPQSFHKEGLVAVFGKQSSKEDFCITWMLPLTAMLLISPEKRQFSDVQRILKANPGDHPVILSLGHGTLQFLPQNYWCRQTAGVTESLKQQGIHYQWVEPMRNPGSD